MKFRVGEIYKDREGREYKFIAYIPEAIESSQLIFLGVAHGGVHTRFTDGAAARSANSSDDILPPEKKTVKLYPALSRKLSTERDYSQEYYVTNTLHDTCPEYAIRLITEWAPVIIEVEE